MVKKRGIYCGTCGIEKGPGSEQDSRCKDCKSAAQSALRIKKRLEAGKPASRPEREPKCDACKEKRLQGISIEGRCNKCVSIGNLERAHNKKIEAGLVVAVRDASFCHVCNIPKVDGRCSTCRLKAAKERKAKKREEAGKRPWGSGRPLTCYLCNAVKERPDASYCNACTSKDNKRRWREVIAPVVNAREVTLICECGKEKSSTRRFYCDACLYTRKLDRTRAAAQVRRDKLKEQGFIIAPALLTEEEKSIRKEARNYLNRLIRHGLVKRSNCAVCGSDKNLEAHHDDYYKPLEVTWLCRIHHDNHHHK